MPRPGSLPADLVSALEKQPDGATIAELVASLNEVRRFPVLRHSVRSALYQHLDGQGEMLFKRLARGRYALKEARASSSVSPG